MSSTSTYALEQAIWRLEKDPVFVRKRRISVLFFAVRLLAMGIEMTVILPSLWLYIEPMGASALFMGFTESAYAFGSMIAFPVSGVLYDKTKRSKEIILVLNALQIAGNLLYSIPASKWCPLTGRFLAGLGDSFAACYLGELTYTYAAKQRIGIIAIIGSGRIIGIMIGPALNFLIAKVSFHIGGWKIDSSNFAGFLMAIVWTLVQIFCACNQLSLAQKVLDESREGIVMNDCEVEESLGNEEKAKLLRSISQQEPEESKRRKHSDVKFMIVLRELCSREFLVLYFLDSVLWVPQQAYNVLFPLITENEYLWGQESTGLLFGSAGLEIILILVAVYVLGHRYPVRDTLVLAIAVKFMAVSMIGLIIESVVSYQRYKVVALMSCLLLLTAATSLSLIASKALITKTLRAEWQGVAHGTYSSVIRVAFMVGPLIGGAAYYDRRIYAYVMLSCCLIALVLLYLVKGRFHRRQDELECR